PVVRGQRTVRDDNSNKWSARGSRRHRERPHRLCALLSNSSQEPCDRICTPTSAQRREFDEKTLCNRLSVLPASPPSFAQRDVANLRLARRPHLHLSPSERPRRPP